MNRERLVLAHFDARTMIESALVLAGMRDGKTKLLKDLLREEQGTALWFEQRQSPIVHPLLTWDTLDLEILQRAIERQQSIGQDTPLTVVVKNQCLDKEWRSSQMRTLLYSGRHLRIGVWLVYPYQLQGSEAPPPSKAAEPQQGPEAPQEQLSLQQGPEAPQEQLSLQQAPEAPQEQLSLQQAPEAPQEQQMLQRSWSREPYEVLDHLSPDLRAQIHYIFARDTTIEHKRKLHRCFFDHMEFQVFCQVLAQCSEDGGWLVLDRATQTMYWYRSKK